MEHNKKQIKSGFLWSALDSFGNQGVGLIISLTLANMLTPSDYGITAMLAIFINISGVFIDSGFCAAITRKFDRNEKDYATTFYFSFLMSIIFYVLMVISGPYIASFYGQPQLVNIIPVISLTLIINVLGIIPNTKITVSLNFKSYAKANLASLIISGIIAIVLALNNFGVWALVYQQVLSCLIRVVILNVIIPWHPVEKFSIKIFKELFSFSSNLLVSNLIEIFYNNIYNIIIGKQYSPKELGLFNQANTLSSLPSTTITWVIQKVTFPLFSGIQNDKEKFNEMFLFGLKSALLFVYPVMFGIAIVSVPLISILLNESWIGSAQYLSILCIAFANYPIHSMNINIIKVKGDSKLILKITILKKILTTIMLFITVPMGIKAICFGLLIISYVELIINAKASSKVTGLSIKEQFQPLSLIVLTTIISSIIGLYVAHNISGDWLILGVTLSVSLIIYISIIFTFDRRFIVKLKQMIK